MKDEVFSHLCYSAKRIVEENERWQELYNILLNEKCYISKDDDERCYQLVVNGVKINNLEAANLIIQGLKREAISTGYNILNEIKSIKSNKILYDEIHNTLGYLGEDSWGIIENNKDIMEDGC